MLGPHKMKTFYEEWQHSAMEEDFQEMVNKWFAENPDITIVRDHFVETRIQPVPGKNDAELIFFRYVVIYREGKE